MNKPILVVMAAGMGSRYGGSKQMDAVGQDGEAIIDYSLLNEEKACVKVLKSTNKWYGVTYQADKEIVVKAILEKHKSGQYNTPLWNERIKLREALNAYDFGGMVTETYSYGEGHINDTFCVRL